MSAAAAIDSSSDAPHLAVSTGEIVSPRPSAAASVPNALVLPAHPTTPAAGSSEAALEAAAGINLRKLSPSDLTFGKQLGEGAFAKVVACSLRSDPSSAFACKIVDKAFVQKMVSGDAGTAVLLRFGACAAASAFCGSLFAPSSALLCAVRAKFTPC